MALCDQKKTVQSVMKGPFMHISHSEQTSSEQVGHSFQWSWPAEKEPERAFCADMPMTASGLKQPKRLTASSDRYRCMAAFES
jgi:hypothetical protein